MRNLVLASAVLLAGCNSDTAPEAQAPVDNVVAEAPAANAFQAANEGDAVDMNDTAPTENQAGEMAEAVIPAAIRGRWGLVPADCTSTGGDNKGLIEVSEKRIKFYESRATLTRVNEQDDTRVDGEFDFSGEGQTWALRMTLDAQDGGQTLVRRDYGKDAMPGPLRYGKCAA